MLVIATHFFSFTESVVLRRAKLEWFMHPVSLVHPSRPALRLYRLPSQFIYLFSETKQYMHGYRYVHQSYMHNCTCYTCTGIHYTHPVPLSPACLVYSRDSIAIFSNT